MTLLVKLIRNYFCILYDNLPSHNFKLKTTAYVRLRCSILNKVRMRRYQHKCIQFK